MIIKSELLLITQEYAIGVRITLKYRSILATTLQHLRYELEHHYTVYLFTPVEACQYLKIISAIFRKHAKYRYVLTYSTGCISDPHPIYYSTL